MEKQKKQKEDEKKGKKIEPALYWEWRTTIEELKVAKLEARRTHLERDLMAREIENKKLKLSLYGSKLQQADVLIQRAEKEYQAVKSRIEETIGQSLEDCVINDVTFEVQSLEEAQIRDIDHN